MNAHPQVTQLSFSLPRPAPRRRDPAGLPEVVVKRLPRNEKGRDFIVGDIHGAYDAVIEGMRKASFNPERDRLISVGDLIDRGRGSSRVVGFLAQPYVHAVRGNHDHEFARLSTEEVRVLATVPRLRMGWAATMSDAALLEIRDALARLPLAMEIETPRGLVGVVHAQPMSGRSWQQFVAALESGDEYAIECALEKREWLRSGSPEVVVGVGRVYVGHTTQESGPRMFGNVVALDTGAVLREFGLAGEHHLTMMNIQARTASLADWRSRADAAAVVLDTEGEGVFSSLRPAAS